MKTLSRDDFSYTCDSQGYMLYYRNKPLGGAGSLPSAKPRHWRHKRADVQMYKESAEHDIDRLVNGSGEKRFMDIIKKVMGQ